MCSGKDVTFCMVPMWYKTAAGDACNSMALNQRFEWKYMLNIIKSQAACVGTQVLSACKQHRISNVHAKRQESMLWESFLYLSVPCCHHELAAHIRHGCNSFQLKCDVDTELTVICSTGTNIQSPK